LSLPVNGGLSINKNIVGRASKLTLKLLVLFCRVDEFCYYLVCKITRGFLVSSSSFVVSWATFQTQYIKFYEIKKQITLIAK
jgi:hypothetical protein